MVRLRWYRLKVCTSTIRAWPNSLDWKPLLQKQKKVLSSSYFLSWTVIEICFHRKFLCNLKKYRWIENLYFYLPVRFGNGLKTYPIAEWQISPIDEGFSRSRSSWKSQNESFSPCENWEDSAESTKENYNYSLWGKKLRILSTY